MKLPIPQQTVRLQGPTADASSFGSLEGNAKKQLGGSLQQVGASLQAVAFRKKNREDVIESVRAVNAYGQEVEQEFTRISTEEDLSSTDTVKSYNNFLRESLNKSVENFKGSPGAREALKADLERQYGNYASAAYKGSISAQFKMMGNYLDSTVNRLSDRAGDVPSAMLENFADLDTEIDKLAPAMTPEMEQGYRIAGKSAIVKSSVSAFLTQGDTAAAREMLDHEGMAELLDPDLHRQLKTQVTVAERQEEKGRIEGEQLVAKAEAITGSPLTAPQKLKLAGLAPEKGPVTFGDQIAQIENVLGRRLTEAEVAKKANIDAANGNGGDFGNSITGRSLSIMNDIGPMMAAGMADESDLRKIDAAIVNYTQPVQYTNPTTGALETRRPGLPPQVVEDYRRAGRPLPNQQGASNPLGTGKPEDAISPAFGDEQPPKPENTIWGRRKDVVGIGASVAESVGGVPVIGEGVGTKTIEARQYAELRQKTLVKALQNSPRFAETERQSLEESFSITGKTFDTESAYTSRIVAIDDYLTEELARASKDATNPQSTTLIRQAALKDLANMTHFQMMLGAPPRVKSIEELKKLNLQPGDSFVDPKGRLGTIPEGGVQ
jgi:hypothetical protein